MEPSEELARLMNLRGMLTGCAMGTMRVSQMGAPGGFATREIYFQPVAAVPVPQWISVDANLRPVGAREADATVYKVLETHPAMCLVTDNEGHRLAVETAVLVKFWELCPGEPCPYCDKGIAINGDEESPCTECAPDPEDDARSM